MADKQKLAILISGRGSNMLAIALACANGELNAEVVLVLSNTPDAAGLHSAAELGLKTTIVDHKAFASRAEFDQQLNAELDEVRPNWIALAGFMRILGGEFVNRWDGQIVNIHPSLLPAYPGLNTHARAIEAGDKKAGATVHYVTSDLDAGPVIAQHSVPIYPQDTEQTLGKRVIGIEHSLYVAALQQCIATQCS